MNTKKVALMIFAYGGITMSYAQYHVKGVIRDELDVAVPYASVLLLQCSDSSLIQGQVSNTEGRFVIESKEGGKVFVMVSAIGYNDSFVAPFELNGNNTVVDVGLIVASVKTEELNEVVIRAEKPLFEQKIDRTIINVQSSISRAGGSALDVLQRSPGVTVDKMNNSVALSGKQGVRIMINGKISKIPMQAVVQMLDGMNAENIERIELITTPPSKYEAEGEAGMINIVLKQSNDFGTNGSLSVFTGYGRDGKYGGTFNINKRTKKLNVFGDLGIRNDWSRQYWNSQWSTLIDGEEVETVSNNERNSYAGVLSGTAGLDYVLSKKTTIGGSINFFDRTWDMDALANGYQNTEGQLDNTITMTTIEQNDWLQVLGNINLQHQFNGNSSLSMDIDRIDYSSSNPTDYVQGFYDNLGSPSSEAQLKSSKSTGIEIWTSAVDFSGRLNEKINFEVGAKGSFSELDNDIVVENLEDGIWVVDESLTSLASMHEDIAAAYASFSIKATSKLDMQLGLRYEHTTTNIDTQLEQDVVDRNYGKWFPTFFMNQKISDKNSWVFSYSRRITRPSFFQLAPFVIFNDPNNFFSGNIALLPSFTDAVKFEYRHKTILMSLQYGHDKNAIALFQPRINDDNKQVSTAQNMDYRDNFSFVLSFPITVTDWWEIQINGMATTSRIKVVYLDEPVSLSVSYFSLNGSQKFKVSKTVTVEMSGFFQSKQLFGVWEFGAIGSLDLGLEKQFKSSSIRLSYSDILQTNKWSFIADIPSENLHTSNYLDFETTILNVTYTKNFGNNKLKGRKYSKTGGSKEEQGRLSQQ